MKKKNKLKVGFITLMSVMVLTACGINKEAEKESSTVSSQSASAVIEKVDSLLDSSEGKEKDSKINNGSDEKKATKAATIVLDYLYKNKTSDLKKVTGVAGSDMNRILEDVVYDSKVRDFPGNDWAIVIDDSIFTSEDIFRQYSKVFIQGFKQIKDYEIKDVSVENDSAEITFLVNPISMPSVSNTIGSERSKVKESLEETKELGMLSGKDVQDIVTLFDFKLYGIAFGEQGKPMNLLGEQIEIEFTLEKDGDKFTTDSETILDLIKQSQVNEYSKKDTASDQKNSVNEESESEL